MSLRYVFAANARWALYRDRTRACVLTATTTTAVYVLPRVTLGFIIINVCDLCEHSELQCRGLLTIRADNGSVGHGSNGSTNLGGSQVSTRVPLTKFQE